MLFDYLQITHYSNSSFREGNMNNRTVLRYYIIDTSSRRTLLPRNRSLRAFDCHFTAVNTPVDRPASRENITFDVGPFSHNSEDDDRKTNPCENSPKWPRSFRFLEPLESAIRLMPALTRLVKRYTHIYE